MPDVVGMSLSAARSELRGTRVTVEEDFDESARDNEVLAQDVAAGDTVPDEVVLTVAKQPVTIYLDDLTPVSEGWYSFDSSQASVDGESYPRSLVTGWTDEAQAGWNLSRGFRELRGTLGRSDDADDPETEAQVEVFLDRRKVYSEVVSFGEPIEMNVDVTDALRLEIVGKSLDGETLDLVLGDIRLLGLPGEVPELEDD